MDKGELMNGLRSDQRVGIVQQTIGYESLLRLIRTFDWNADSSAMHHALRRLEVQAGWVTNGLLGKGVAYRNGRGYRTKPIQPDLLLATFDNYTGEVTFIDDMVTGVIERTGVPRYALHRAVSDQVHCYLNPPTIQEYLAPLVEIVDPAAKRWMEGLRTIRDGPAAAVKLLQEFRD